MEAGGDGRGRSSVHYIDRRSSGLSSDSPSRRLSSFCGASSRVAWHQIHFALSFTLTGVYKPFTITTDTIQYSHPLLSSLCIYQFFSHSKAGPKSNCQVTTARAVTIVPLADKLKSSAPLWHGSVPRIELEVSSYEWSGSQSALSEE